MARARQLYSQTGGLERKLAHVRHSWTSISRAHGVEHPACVCRLFETRIGCTFEPGLSRATAAAPTEATAVPRPCRTRDASCCLSIASLLLLVILLLVFRPERLDFVLLVEFCQITAAHRTWLLRFRQCFDLLQFRSVNLQAQRLRRRRLR